MIPDLAPDFTRQTITSQLAIVEPMLEAEPAILFGSSLGGYLAALVATRRPGHVRGLVLLAPAFGFAQRWEARLTADAFARWRRDGTMPVFHYGLEREVPLEITFLDDARHHPEQPDPSCPALVIAGRQDDAVPLATVERFAAARSGRELAVYDAGHQLTDVLVPMWKRTASFLSDLGA